VVCFDLGRIETFRIEGGEDEEGLKAFDLEMWQDLINFNVVLSMTLYANFCKISSQRRRVSYRRLGLTESMAETNFLETFEKFHLSQSRCFRYKPLE
jgi:hypothetical protein